ncbi:MAG: aromatic ring-hydroxylating dioxygenase subunit alpha [Terrimicrobiaceae bacterium]|nr:aromatic ring-hydroxylating dioxygenase subunit alpha [Terrimicrobiaceae bacterium]
MNDTSATFFGEATVKDGGSPLTGRHGLGGLGANYRSRQSTMPLDDLLAEIQVVADLPLERGRTFPAEAYTSPEFLEWEVEHVLGANWICLAHVSQIPKPGDFINVDVLGEPLIVVHGKDGQVRVLSRVCPHRAMDIMPQGFGYDGYGPADPREGSPGCGHTRLFLCPYHHWSFELDGSLKGCPEMQKAEGFCRDETGLKNFRCEVWKGFVFLNLSGNATPVAEQFAELGKDIEGWDPANLKVVIAKEWDCPFNWKVLVENFMEAYHHLGAHCKTLQILMPAKNTWTEAERAHSMRVNLPFKDSVAGDPDVDFATIPTLPPDQVHQMAVYLGQPSFLLFTGPDRLFWYRIDPITPDRSRLLTTCLVNDSAFADPDFGKKLEAANRMLVDFHLEDMEVCTAVQRGFYAKGYQRGRLSHLEMPIWLFQRYLAARARGTYPTLDRPAAPGQR